MHVNKTKRFMQTLYRIAAYNYQEFVSMAIAFFQLFAAKQKKHRGGIMDHYVKVFLFFLCFCTHSLPTRSKL